MPVNASLRFAARFTVRPVDEREFFRAEQPARRTARQKARAWIPEVPEVIRRDDAGSKYRSPAAALEPWMAAEDHEQRLSEILNDATNTGKRICKTDWLESYPWLAEAIQLEEAGRDDLALQKIYTTMSAWLGQQEFKRVNELLRAAAVDELSVDILLAF